jgi:hypoxia up-regulated 1
LNVNADEAAVLGPALYGACFSRQFKTKPIKVVNIVQISYFAAPSTANSRPRSPTSVMSPAGPTVGAKKVLRFKRKEDFSVFLDYKSLAFVYVLNLHPPSLSLYNIDDVISEVFQLVCWKSKLAA